MEHNLDFELTSPLQPLSHRALLAEFDNAAAFAVILMESEDASARKAAAFLSTGREDNMASLGVPPLTCSSN